MGRPSARGRSPVRAPWAARWRRGGVAPVAWLMAVATLGSEVGCQVRVAGRALGRGLPGRGLGVSGWRWRRRALAFSRASRGLGGRRWSRRRPLRRVAAWRVRGSLGAGAQVWRLSEGGVVLSAPAVVVARGPAVAPPRGGALPRGLGRGAAPVASGDRARRWPLPGGAAGSPASAAACRRLGVRRAGGHVAEPVPTAGALWSSSAGSVCAEGHRPGRGRGAGRREVASAAVGGLPSVRRRYIGLDWARAGGSACRQTYSTRI
jgi:hypothetical protein